MLSSSVTSPESHVNVTVTSPGPSSEKSLSTVIDVVVVFTIWQLVSVPSTKSSQSDSSFV